MTTFRFVQPLGLLAARAALASVTLGDPSDVIPASDWAADNAIIPDYNVPFLEYQPSDSESPYLLATYRVCVALHHDIVIRLTKTMHDQQSWL